MLTNDEIGALENVHLASAKVALEQSERRLADFIDVRKALESKQTSLFSAFIGFTMAICGIGAALAQKPEYAAFASRFYLSAVPFGVGAILFLMGLWPTVSGYLGSLPENWLQVQLLTGGDAELAKMHAFMANNVTGRITAAKRDIERKQRIVMAGMVCGIIGMVMLAYLLWSFQPSAVVGAPVAG